MSTDSVSGPLKGGGACPVLSHFKHSLVDFCNNLRVRHSAPPRGRLRPLSLRREARLRTGNRARPELRGDKGGSMSTYQHRTHHRPQEDPAPLGWPLASSPGHWKGPFRRWKERSCRVTSAGPDGGGGSLWAGLSRCQLREPGTRMYVCCTE